MANDKIAYTNKVGVKPQIGPDENNWKDENANEVKTVVNLHADKLDLIDEFVQITETGDDRGVNIPAQLSVDDEIISGKDSYPVPIAFHFDHANMVGNVITSAVNITTILQSDNSSSVGLFNGIVAGKCILVGSPDAKDTYEGVKVKYNTLGTVEGDNILAEFRENDINEWVPAPFMATNSSYPHMETGDNISVNDSEQIFFGFDPLTRMDPSTWESTILNINGVDLNFRWALFRITADITLDPIIEQVKLHTDRIEIERYGIFKFGKARSILPLFSGVSNIIKNKLKDPDSEAVFYTPDSQADYKENEFANLKEDGFVAVIGRKYGLDTSIPIIVNLSYYVKGAATGDIDLKIQGSQVVDGYVYDGSEPYSESQIIETVPTPSDLVRRTVSFKVAINKLQSNSGIVLNIYRDALVGNTVDTLAGNIVITHIDIYGYSWKI
jgi:hypothetical protein